MTASPSTPDRAPLAGIRVLALEHAVAAPLCTRHLSDLGADVIKIERPGGGDFARSYDSVVGGESAYFVWLNRGKRSVLLDLKSLGDRATLDHLLGSMDVLVSNLSPGALDRLGLGWDTLHQQWPRLISCDISGFGPDGPQCDRKSFDLLMQGEAGLLAVTGTPEHPAKMGLPVADISAGMYALTSIVAALFQREKTGQATRIDVAMIDCLAEWMTPAVYHRTYTGEEPVRMGAAHNTICPYGPYRVGGGAQVNLAVQNARQWEGFCREVLERPDVATDPRFGSNEQRVRHRRDLDQLIEGCLATRPLEEVLAALERADVPWGEVNDVAGLVAHPQLESRGRWLQVDTPSGSVRALKPPFNIRGCDVPVGPVPGLGQHTATVMAEVAAHRLAVDGRNGRDRRVSSEAASTSRNEVT